MPSTPTLRRRKFGRLITSLRDAAGKTTLDAAGLLHRDASQISKIENGWYLPAFAELAALLAFYRASEDERQQAELLYSEAKQGSRRLEGSSGVPPKFRAFLRAEADAATLKELQPSVVPGLLQTDEYYEAVRNAGRRIVDPTIDADRAMAARRARRNRFLSSSSLKFHAIIDEGVVRRVVGGNGCMARQLLHITDLASRDNVTVQVMREDAGAYGTMSGALAILGFDDPDYPDTAYLEYQGGGEWVDDADNVKSFNLMFEDLSGQASSTAESMAIIAERARELNGAKAD
jgi:transcriptional regulator with XRE-family HTH domain